MTEYSDKIDAETKKKIKEAEQKNINLNVMEGVMVTSGVYDYYKKLKDAKD